MDTRKLMDGQFIKPNVNVHQGDVIEFLDGGKEVPDKNDMAKTQFQIQVAVTHNGVKGAEKTLGLNMTNHKAIVALFGYESENWIGKKVTAHIIKRQNPAGQLVDALALSAVEIPF